jgi:hypothetical protein
MLSAPGVVHPGMPTAADYWAQSTDRPHPLVSRAGAAADRWPTRRRWVLRWRGGHHCAPRTEAKPRVTRTRPAELSIELTGVHGGVVALAPGGLPAQAAGAAEEACTSTAGWKRCWWPRPKRERGWRELRPRAPANCGHGEQRRGTWPNWPSPKHEQ